MKDKPLEATLYPALEKGAIADGWPLTRISDGSFGKKCGDFVGVAPNGLGVLLEVKVINKLPANSNFFPWQVFESHQIQWLKAYEKTGAFALAALFEWQTDTMRVYRIQLQPPYPHTDLTLGKGGWVGWSQLL